MSPPSGPSRTRRTSARSPPSCWVPWRWAGPGRCWWAWTSTEELRLKRWWTLEGERPEEPDQLILGQEAAHRLKAAPGQQLEHPWQSPSPWRPCFSPSATRRTPLIYADLAVVQQLLGKPGKVSLVEVSALCSTCPIEQIVAQIGEKLPGAKVTALAQAMKSPRADGGAAHQLLPGHRRGGAADRRAWWC